MFCSEGQKVHPAGVSKVLPGWRGSTECVFRIALSISHFLRLTWNPLGMKQQDAFLSWLLFPWGLRPRAKWAAASHIWRHSAPLLAGPAWGRAGKLRGLVGEVLFPLRRDFPGLPQEYSVLPAYSLKMWLIPNLCERAVNQQGFCLFGSFPRALFSTHSMNEKIAMWQGLNKLSKAQAVKSKQWGGGNEPGPFQVQGLCSLVACLEARKGVWKATLHGDGDGVPFLTLQNYIYAHTALRHLIKRGNQPRHRRGKSQQDNYPSSLKLSHFPT